MEKSFFTMAILPYSGWRRGGGRRAYRNMQQEQPNRIVACISDPANDNHYENGNINVSKITAPPA